MKIVFLLQEKNILKVTLGTSRPFRFKWFLFGPFSREVLDYLDSLVDKRLVDILPGEIYIYNTILADQERSRETI